ncbi:Fic family protein [Candidatus Microgenomates bacterium]|nr:Fic family protein [Candidatus Microgenomates bacterium]
MYSPKFIITNEILTNIGIIEAAREVIDNAALVPAYEKKFRDEALIRTVHHGTHIEGNKLNLLQAERILAGQNVVARDRDIWEVINYRRVMEFISKLKVDSGELKIDEGMIKEVHKLTVNKILPVETVGKYRKTQVVVKNNRTGKITFRPPPALEVSYQIEDFLVWLNNTKTEPVHPVLKSGVVHYEIARIHPFIDGNGRVARALSTLILFIDGYDIRRFFSLEEYFDITKGLAIELSKIKEKVQKLSVDVKIKEKLGGQIALSERQIKIIEYIQRVGFLQNQAFESLFTMVSEDTILRELKDLLKKKIIKKKGRTKGAKYILA